MATSYIKGGDKMQAYLTELSRKVKRAAKVRVGFLEGATYTDGNLPVAAVAAIQNFGAPAAGIPPRPFFTNMVKEKSPDWGEALAETLKASDYDASRALGMMGEGIKSQLQDSIVETMEPALSPVTLAVRKWKADNPGKPVTAGLVAKLRKKVADGTADTSGVSTKPLVETGQLLNSADYEVK